MSKDTPQIETPPPSSGGGLGATLGVPLTFIGRKTLNYLPPFAAWAAEWPVAWGAHQQWGGSPGAAIALTLGSVALTAHTWWVGTKTTKQRQILSTLTTGAASGWLTAATVAGPSTPEVLNAWLMGGPMTALAWAITMGMRINPEKTESDGDDKSLFSKIGLARTRAREIKVEPNKATIPISLDRGVQTHDDAAKAGPRLASALGVSPNAVRWQPDPEDAAQGAYVVVPEDMLKEPTPWPGPSCPGGSIADAPIPLGIYEDGPQAAIWFSGDEAEGRNAAHYQFMGMTGAGKSQGGRVILADLMTRRDVVIWGLDPSKGLQTFGPIVGGMDWAALTMAECRTVINILPDVITARADELGRHGYDQWTPEAGAQLNMPYLIIWCEEVAKLFREGEEILPITQELRSAGGSIVLSLQRSSHTIMPTDVRANLAGATVFGVNGTEDAGMALSDEVIDAGARPEVWRNRKPGYCYCEGPGIEPDRFATAIRTYFQDKSHGSQVVAAYESVRAPDAGPVTSRAAGLSYEHRTRYTSLDQAAAAEQRPPQVAGEEDDDLTAEDMALHATDPEYADLDVDIDRELPPAPPGLADMPLGTPLPVSKLTREQSLAELMAVLQEFADRGQLEIGPADITPLLPRIGKSASWVRGEFRRLEDAGTLGDSDKPGVYRIRHLTPA